MKKIYKVFAQNNFTKAWFVAVAETEEEAVAMVRETEKGYNEYEVIETVEGMVYRVGVQNTY